MQPPRATPHTCGFFRGRPRPLFCDASFSPLEARAWLDLAPDSLIVLPAAVRKSERRRKVSQCWVPTPVPLPTLPCGVCSSIPPRDAPASSQHRWAAERTGYQAGSCPSPTESAHVLVLGQPPGSPAGAWGAQPHQPFPQSPAPCPETRRAAPDLIWNLVNPRHAVSTGKLEQDRWWHRTGAPAPSTAAPQPCSCRPTGFRDSTTWHLS